jgi:hypothetical protein
LRENPEENLDSRGIFNFHTAGRKISLTPLKVTKAYID